MKGAGPRAQGPRRSPGRGRRPDTRRPRPEGGTWPVRRSGPARQMSVGSGRSLLALRQRAVGGDQRRPARARGGGDDAAALLHRERMRARGARRPRHRPGAGGRGRRRPRGRGRRRRHPCCGRRGCPWSVDHKLPWASWTMSFGARKPTPSQVSTGRSARPVPAPIRPPAPGGPGLEARRPAERAQQSVRRGLPAEAGDGAAGRRLERRREHAAALDEGQRQGALPPRRSRAGRRRRGRQPARGRSGRVGGPARWCARRQAGSAHGGPSAWQEGRPAPRARCRPQPR